MSCKFAAPPPCTSLTWPLWRDSHYKGGDPFFHLTNGYLAGVNGYLAGVNGHLALSTFGSDFEVGF